MMQPPPPLYAVHTTPCLSPFLLAIQYRMGGGYELSNPKGNVPRRQLPSEKWPFLGRMCVCVLHTDVWVLDGWRVWHGPAGVAQLWTDIPTLHVSVPIHTHICKLWLMTTFFFPCFFFLVAMLVKQAISFRGLQNFCCFHTRMKASFAWDNLHRAEQL